MSRARGGDPLDPANVLLVCRFCHDWITTHPAEAEHLGLAHPTSPRVDTEVGGEGQSPTEAT